MQIQGSSVRLQGGKGIPLQGTKNPQLTIGTARLQPAAGAGVNQQPVYKQAAPAAKSSGAYYQPAASGGAYGRGGSGGGTVGDAATAAYYQDTINQLNAQQGRLIDQNRIGDRNIDNSYNQNLNRLNAQSAIADRDYQTGIARNTQNYSNTRTGILNNTRNTNNALQRLLGLNGAGNSSAALEQAPYAAALEGTTNLNAAQQTFANNSSALDTNYGDTKRKFKYAREDLDNQRYQQRNALKASIAKTRADLLDKIANADIQRRVAMGENAQSAIDARKGTRNQINDLLDRIVGLGSQFGNTIKAQSVDVGSPELGDFSLGQMAAPQQTAGGISVLDPTFYNLINRDEERGL